MKNLTERTEIAKAMNFGKYPVLKLDIADSDEYGLKGVPCRIDMGNFSDGEKFYKRAILRAFSDECYPHFTTYGCCLSDRWGYTDIIEDYEYAISPIIKPNEEFVLIVLDSIRKEVCRVMILTAKNINKYCSTPIDCEKVDLTNCMIMSEARYHNFTVKIKEEN